MSAVHRGAALLAIVLAVLWGGLTGPVQAATAAKALPVFPAWTGDLDGMRELRRIRILVPYSKTDYFIDKGREMGAAAELGHQLEDWLNRKFRTGSLRLQVAFVPTARDRLIPALREGLGDIIAGDLTVTDERRALVDFVRPWLDQVNEVVVAAPTAPRLDHLDDLAGRHVMVRRSSSYFTHLSELNRALGEKGLAPIQVVEADEDLEDEDLMEMANAGLVDYLVVDDHKALLWARIFRRLSVRTDLAIAGKGQVAWAIRRDSPLLHAVLDEFVGENGIGTSFGNAIKQRYYKQTTIIKDAYSKQDQENFVDLVRFFKKYGDQFGFDYLMVAAQGYQESRLDQSFRSPRGAVGVMQMLPSTAADPKVGVRGIESSAERNILAGVKYLHLMTGTYLDEPGIDDKNRMLMAFAAYNAGPTNLKRFRQLAAASGLDANVWFGNVEQAAARIVGRETVQYVGNIYKYFVAYRLLMERRQATLRALEIRPGRR